MSHQQDQKPQAANPRLGRPQIKRGAPGVEPAAATTGGTPAEPQLPTRRSLRQHRRADSDAGAPAGDLSKATILELPATSISPADVGPLTGQLPRVIYATGEPGGGAYAIKSPDEAGAPTGGDTAPADRPALKARRATGAADRGAGGPGKQSTASAAASSADLLPEDVTLDRDGVPVGPDGQPLSRRQLREWRRQQGTAIPVAAMPAVTAAAGGPAPLESASAGERGNPEPVRPSTRREATRARRAEAPAGAPSGAVAESAEITDGGTSTSVAPGASAGQPFTRESLAAEGAALAARIEAAAGADPSTVDPALLREQELLAEKARQLNTGLIRQVSPSAPQVSSTSVARSTAVSKPAAGPAAPKQGTVSPTGRHDPVDAQSAHGLDSIQASEWSSRERTLMIVAGIVVLILVVALILAIVF
ncbi:hypothetical protein ACFFIO_01210 [Citricoccus parietis]|uniref:Uncharacterized protein n=1 Tax=Citricoccus parietis TaxID=592307 RepID=A0ABV6F0T0_9MICC